MIPNTGYAPEIFGSIKKVKYPSKTYKIDFENNQITGEIIDGIEALKQSIYLILLTERYEYLIYSWNYGIEIKTLFDKQKQYIIPQLQSRITEALMCDDRIEELSDFVFDVKKSVYSVSFNVLSNIADEKIKIEFSSEVK